MDDPVDRGRHAWRSSTAFGALGVARPRASHRLTRGSGSLYVGWAAMSARSGTSLRDLPRGTRRGPRIALSSTRHAYQGADQVVYLYERTNT